MCLGIIYLIKHCFLLGTTYIPFYRWKRIAVLEYVVLIEKNMLLDIRIMWPKWNGTFLYQTTHAVWIELCICGRNLIWNGGIWKHLFIVINSFQQVQDFFRPQYDMHNIMDWFPTECVDVNPNHSQILNATHIWQVIYIYLH